MPAPSWDTAHWTQDQAWSGSAFDVDGVTPIFVAQSGSALYGDLIFTPTGGWEVGFRPSSVVIDMTIDPAMDLTISFISVTATSGPSVSVPLLGAVFPLAVDMSTLTADISAMTFYDVHGDSTPGRVDSVVFSTGCSLFWTNHTRQFEVC